MKCRCGTVMEGHGDVFACTVCKREYKSIGKDLVCRHGHVLKHDSPYYAVYWCDTCREHYADPHARVR